MLAKILHFTIVQSMTFRAFELAVDILLSRNPGPYRSVFELPGLVVQRAYQDKLTPEEFVESLKDNKKSEDKPKRTDDSSGDLFG